jgi:hypothetical protein
MVVIPQMSEQEFVARRTEELGAGIFLAKDQALWIRSEDCSAIGDLIVGTQVMVTSGYLKKTSWTCGFLAGIPWRPDATPGNKWFSDSLLPLVDEVTFGGDPTPTYTHTVIHNLGTTDVSVQVIDTKTGETIHPFVDRIDLNRITVSVQEGSLIIDPNTALLEEVPTRILVSGTYSE